MQQINLSQFQGPLDVLLELIEDKKLDVSEISLAAVTEQFMSVVKQMSERGELDQIAEFLDIAARLLLIKSRALLPGQDEAETEEIEDLKAQLIEYKRYREAARHFAELLSSPYRSFRPSKINFAPAVEFLPPVNIEIKTLYDAFTKLIADLPAEESHERQELTVERLTVEDKIKEIGAQLTPGAKLAFEQLLAAIKTKYEAIITFLALLELIKARRVQVSQGDLFGQITLEAL